MYIGIDLGTSSVKMILTDSNQNIIATANSGLTVQSPKDGYNEQNPQEWVNATIECFELLRSQKPKEFCETISIGISGHMHGATLVDKDGEVIRPCILWNDTRSHEECIEFENQGIDVRSISGNITMPGFTAPKINWIKKHESENFSKIFKVLLPKDYLRFYLTGEFFSEMSDASGTLWLDIKKRKWSENLLSCSFLEEKHMPKLVEGNEEAGTLKNKFKEKFNFKNTVSIVGGAGDNAAAAAGMGITEQNQSFISLGTSGVFFTPTQNFLSNTGDAVHSFCHCLPNTWHHMSVMLSATNCIDWISNTLGLNINKSFEHIEDYCLNILQENNTPYFLPYLSGERTPHNNSNIRGSFHQINTSTTKSAMLYAVLEGVTFGIKNGYEIIEEINNKTEETYIVGGGSKSEFWANFISSAINKKIIIGEDSNLGPSLGVARLAMMATNNFSKKEVFKKMPIKKETHINEQLSNILDKRYKKWLEIVSTNLQIADKLL